MRCRRAVVGVGLLVVVTTGCSGDRAGTPPASRPPEGVGSRSGSPPEPAPADAAVPPDSPRGAADLLVAADRALRDPSSSRSLVSAAGHTQQLAVRELADRPAWGARVASLLPTGVRRDTAANVAARRAFRSMHPGRRSDLAGELPAWRIRAPLPAAVLRRHYREAERRYGVDWEYLAAINFVETGFGRIDGTSVAGAQGPMQFIPTTWDLYGEGGDIHHPRDAILAAARLLRAGGFADDPGGALHRYNNSEAYVRGVSLHARVMQRRPHTFRGYHQWQVYYLTRHGSILLPEGYAEPKPVPVRQWLRRHSGGATD